jgi:RND family efflux transporter MFP subunit
MHTAPTIEEPLELQPVPASAIPTPQLVRPPRRGRWAWAGLALVAIGSVIAAGVVAQAGKKAESQASPTAARSATTGPAPVVITVEPVTARKVRRTIEVVGSLFGWEEIVVSPRVEGRVLVVRRDVGDVVKPGTTLLEIDPTDYQLAVEEQQRGLELELAKLGLSQLPQGVFNIETLPTVVRAAAMEKNALTKYRRMDSLRKSGGISPEEADTAATELTVATANFQQAKLDAAATLATARHRHASLATARQKLSDCTVSVPTVTVPPGTPCEFTITARTVNEGEVVRPGGGSVFRLVLPRTLKLFASVPERFLADVSGGQVAELEVEAYPGQRFAGSVARVNPSVDRGTRMFQVEVHVPNANGKLRPGSFAKGRLVAREEDRVLTVPEEAIQSFAGVVKVFVHEGDTVRAVPVTTGMSTTTASTTSTARTWIEVRGDGIREGASVATSGLLKLADGTTVRVRK